MIAGLILTDSTSKKSSIAFLDDDSTESFQIEENPELVQLIAERKPDIIAVNSSTDKSPEELTEKESELKEAGHAFTPNSHQKTIARRLEALESLLFEKMGAEGPEFVRFDPAITSKELAIDGDEALESIGVNTSEITSSREFDAVLGAVTARFYQQNQYKDLGVIVPESLKSEN